MWLFLMEADDHDRGKNNGGGVAFSGGLLVFDAQWVTYCHLLNTGAYRGRRSWFYFQFCRLLAV